MPKTKAVMIFLTLFAVVLGIYIGTQGFGIYMANKNITATKAIPAIECARYVYTVQNPDYDGYAVSFEMINLDYSLQDIHNVTVAGITQKSAETKNFVPGVTKQIKINDIKIEHNFSVYVDNCEIYKNTCFLEENICG